MRHLALALVALAVVANLFAVAGEEAPDRKELYKKLHDENTKSEAFEQLANNVKEVNRYFESISCNFIQQLTNSEIAVVRIKSRCWMCGNGLYDGGIESASEIVDQDRREDLFIVDDSGKKLLMIQRQRSSMEIADVDGDGVAQELVRWGNTYEEGRDPFLIIHDLTKPNFPAMLNVRFNPHMKEETQTIRRGDEDALYEPRVPARPKPTRTGRWSLVGRKVGEKNVRDILIEEKIGAEYKEVARFVYDATLRKWEGPAGSDDDLWKIGDDEHYRGTFVDPNIIGIAFKRRSEAEQKEKAKPAAAPADK